MMDEKQKTARGRYDLTRGVPSTAMARVAALLYSLPIATPRPVLAQKSSAAPVIEVALDVTVDEKIVDACDLKAWIREDGRAVFQNLSKRGSRGTLVLRILGRVYDYEITMIARRKDKLIDEPIIWHCECSNEELQARLRTELPIAADRLVATSPTEVPKTAPRPTLPPETAHVVDVRSGRRSLGNVGGAGITLLSVGAAGITAGSVLVALGVDRRRGDRPDGDIEVQDHRTPGTTVIVGSAGLALMGVVMLLLHRRS